MSKGELLLLDETLDYGEKYYIGDKIHYCDEADLDFSGETVKTMLNELGLPLNTEVRFFDSSAISRNNDKAYNDLMKELTDD